MAHPWDPPRMDLTIRGVQKMEQILALALLAIVNYDEVEGVAPIKELKNLKNFGY